jgi:hypothetical protein
MHSAPAELWRLQFLDRLQGVFLSAVPIRLRLGSEPHHIASVTISAYIRAIVLRVASYQVELASGIRNVQLQLYEVVLENFQCVLTSEEAHNLACGYSPCWLVEVSWSAALPPQLFW